MSTPRAGSFRRTGIDSLAVAGIVGLVLLAADRAGAQAPVVEQALQQQIAAAVAGDEAAFRSVMRQYADYKDLVARGRVAAGDVAVLDNQLWAKSQQVWAEVKKLHGAELERIDNVGSGTYRSDVSGYKPGKSDTDYIPRGAQAEDAAEDFTRLMQRELGGVHPQTVGMNALAPVDVTNPASLRDAQLHPEKYPTAERIKALEHQNWERGTTTTWDGAGQQQFTTTKDYFAQKGLAPPPAPVATDAFGIHAAEQKFLTRTPPVTPAGALSQAVHDSKYLNRAVGNAADVAGIPLTPAEQSLFREMQILANTKNVIPALKGRIDLLNGDVNAAVREYLTEARALNDALTQKLFDQHVKLLADLQAKAPAAAAQAEKNLAHSLAVLSEGQAGGLAKASTATSVLQSVKVSDVLADANGIRSEAAAGARQAAAEARRVASLAPTLAAELKLPSGELKALSERIGLLELSPGGRKLLTELGEALAKRPILTTAGGALTALAIYWEIKQVATVAGEKGLAAGSLAAGNAAADWALMAVSPAYGGLRLMQGVGAFAVDLALLGPMKDFAGRAAYEGGGGFLGEQGIGRGDLARHYDTEAAALAAAATWFDTKKTTGTFTYLGQADVRAAFLAQVQADYHQSALLKFAQEYTVGASSQWGFFALVGGGDLTFQNFALRFPTRERAEQAIDYFLREKYNQVTEPPGIGRNEAERFLKTYLLALWQASQSYNAQLAQAKGDAEQRLANDAADRQRREDEKTAEARKATSGLVDVTSVGVARTLARDLKTAVSAADAAIKELRPLTARVEEIRRQTNELRTKLDALRTSIDTYCRRAAAGSAAPASQAPDPKLPAELAGIARQADGVCRAADQAVSAFKQQQINAQGVSFRLENALRPPQQDAERRLDTARRSLDALAGSASGDAALLQVAERAYQEAAALAQQASDLAAAIDTTTAMLQQRVMQLRTAATEAADLRQRFIDGVQRVQGVSPEQDAELRGLVQDAGPLTIDAAGIAELETAARSFAALSALLTNDIARRVPPPCPALVALGDRRAAISPQYAALKVALDDAVARVSAGRVCLDRLSALVPPTAVTQVKTEAQEQRERAALEQALKTAIGSVEEEKTAKPMPQGVPDAACVARCATERDRWIAEADRMLAGRKYYAGFMSSNCWSLDDAPQCPVILQTCRDACKYDNNCYAACSAAFQACCGANAKTSAQRDYNECVVRCPASKAPVAPPPPPAAASKLAACYKSEQDYYQAAVDWFPKIRDKNAFSHWSPDPQHSAQEVPAKACSDGYDATRNNPGMREKAWDILQECGWKAEIQKRKEALEKKKAQCAQAPAKP